MHIEFDATKNAANVRDRGLSFEQVAGFDFGTARIWQDARKPYPETRFVALGWLDQRLHVMCFTPVADGIRIISFRKANTREVKIYEQTQTTD
jgi:uncharacterized DUF497 family protein